MKTTRFYREKIQIIGIKVPHWCDVKNILHFSLENHISELLNHLTQTIKNLSDDPDQLNIIVLAENAFTPFPISSTEKKKIREQFRAELKKRSDIEIWLIGGTFLNEKISKMSDKNIAKIKTGLEYHQEILNDNTTIPVLKKYSEKEIILHKKILQESKQGNKKELRAMKNTAMILFSNPNISINKKNYRKEWIERDKIDEYMEKIRFDDKNPHHAAIKEETIFLQGKITDVIHTIRRRDGTDVKVGIFICFEHTIKLADRIYKLLKEKQLDILVILSDSLNELIKERLSGKLVIHMDSMNGLYVEADENKYEVIAVQQVIKSPNELLYDAICENKKININDALGSGANLVTVLCLAIKKNEIKVVDYVIKIIHDYYPLGINLPIDTENNTCLHLAVLKGNLDLVKLFIEHGANILVSHQDQLNPFLLAIAHGHLMIVEYFIQKGARLDQTDAYLETPLHLAAKAGKNNIIKYLINQKLNVNATNLGGDTPLHLATLYGHVNTAEILIQSGAEVNARNIYGETSLKIAANRGDLNCVQLLVKYKAEVNTINCNGDTPLFAAIKSKNFKLVQYLIINGANLNHTNNNAETVFLIASNNGDIEMMKYLSAVSNVKNTLLQESSLFSKAENTTKQTPTNDEVFTVNKPKSNTTN